MKLLFRGRLGNKERYEEISLYEWTDDREFLDIQNAYINILVKNTESLKDLKQLGADDLLKTRTDTLKEFEKLLDELKNSGTGKIDKKNLNKSRKRAKSQETFKKQQ